MQFSFLLTRDLQADDKKIKSYVSFILYYASTNTFKMFENPVVIDNKKDIENVISTITKTDLIEYFMLKSTTSSWKFYKFLGVEFHIYEMSSPIGKATKRIRF